VEKDWQQQNASAETQLLQAATAATAHPHKQTAQHRQNARKTLTAILEYAATTYA
jgi:hypothetical protein